MTSSIYLDREEELLLDKLSGVNRLSRNTVLRLALRELATRADPQGQLPLLGKPMMRLDPITGKPPSAPGAGELDALGG